MTTTATKTRKPARWIARRLERMGMRFWSKFTITPADYNKEEIHTIADALGEHVGEDAKARLLIMWRETSGEHAPEAFRGAALYQRS